MALGVTSVPGNRECHESARVSNQERCTELVGDLASPAKTRLRKKLLIDFSRTRDRIKKSIDLTTVAIASQVRVFRCVAPPAIVQMSDRLRHNTALRLAIPSN